jgi:hypothetical protein
MRTFALLLCSACTASVATPDDPPDSVRERLERDDTQLLMSPADSRGVITAGRRTSDGWQTGIVDLHVESGELVLSADSSGAITLQHFALALAPIDVPASVIGHGAQLSQVRLDVAKPVRVDASWTDDNDSHGKVELDLVLSWALVVDGSTAPLGAPNLPAVPGELVLTGDGSVVHAGLRIHAPGELWSWAGLVKLEDLELVLAARTSY